MQGQGLVIPKRGETEGEVNMGKGLAAKKEQIRSPVPYSTVSSHLSPRVVSLLFSLTSQSFLFSFKL